jgi:hypothetical protein
MSTFQSAAAGDGAGGVDTYNFDCKLHEHM